MNMKRLMNIVLVAALVFAAPVQALVKYSCDFETEAARNRWVVNPTANKNIYNQLVNMWYVGEPGNNDRHGHYGLYISDDNGQSAHYSNNGCWVFAYDTLSLPYMANDDYTLSFDWTAMANVASKFDGLYVFWIPMTEYNQTTGQYDSVKVGSIATSSGTIPSTYVNYVLQLQPTAQMDYLNGSATWRQCAVKIKGKKCDGTPHYLAFVWTNGAHQAQQPGAMVDNIEISDSQPCDAPTSLTVTPNGTTVQLNWQGSFAEYEVSAYSYETGTWSGPRTVTGNQTQFSNLPIGQTDFIVRSKCSDSEYSLKTIVSKLIYYPDQLCVDYLNLDNAKCYIDNSSPDNTRTFNDFKLVQPVDLGPSNIKSRHVVHFDRQEVEPRTGGVAKTIPDGELASVRLGNWEADNHAERIEFSFDVDTVKYPVLLLKYLPILEAPGHEDHENPRFKLDILVGGQSIGRCGMADFNANDVLVNGNGKVKPEYAAQGWHKTDSKVAQTSADIVWKEWTTVGVNLRKPEYQGKKLTARLTTHDCTFSAHCGYAYFTLGCSDGKLKGMKCGQINPVFEAPDGFEYRWMYASSEKYRRKDGSVPEQYVLGRGKKYEAGMHDDSLYVVDCMFVQDSTCYFPLYASTLATNPIAKMKKPHRQMNCKEEKYTYSFDASPSWVQEIDHVKGDTSVSKSFHIESYEWNVEGLTKNNWSDEITPTFTFPSEGGDYQVKLRVTCGTCDSTIYYNLHLDPLGATRDTTTVVLCDADRKAGYVWTEKPDTAYHACGLDSIVLFNAETSCDSILYLKLIEPLRIYEDTMLLPESLPFTYHGRTYGPGTKTMVDTVPSPTNCDSTWVLNLEIYESLIATMPNQAYVLCEGDPVLSIIYNIARGRSLRASYSFSSPEIGDTLINGMQKKGHYQTDLPLDDIYPNVYNGTLLLVDSMPEFSVTIPFTVTMNYSKDVITQRWNDVLAIRNADYNGGYQFDSVQWYLGGLPIEGAIDFNYYAGMGNKLQFGSEYTALLTRNDGVKLFTCPFIPTAVPAEIADLPSLVPLSAPMHVQGKGTATWVDMLGRVHHTDAYDNSDIVAPGITGYFLLVLQGNDSRTIHHVMVR